MEKFDLQERLIDLAVRVIKLCESLPNTFTGQHIAGQLIRSGTSAAPNYGESLGAESRADFIHKLGVALKEMRETHVWLRIIVKAGLVNPPEKLQPLLQETEELVSILFASVTTAKRNNQSKRNPAPNPPQSPESP